MTQPALDFDRRVSSPPRGKTPRVSLTERVAEYFKARPHVWIDGRALEGIGGAYAWRSRVSNCRRGLDMRIDNRVRTVREHTADCPALQAWDIDGACHCGKPRRFTISEYRYVPAHEAREGE